MPEPESPLRPKQEPDITNALSALNIEAQASDADKNATLRSRRVKKSTVPEPGLMSNEPEEEDHESVKRWQEAIVTPMKPLGGSQVRQRMPGTLYTPDPSFFRTQNPDNATQEDIKPSSQSTSTSALSRTWSTEERNSFLNNLAKISSGPPTTTFRFMSDDISLVEEDAKRLGFHSRVIKHDVGVSLILGRTAVAVDGAFHAAIGEGSENTNTVAPKGGQGVAFAGGAVVGAVATFTGLAFS